MVMVLAQRVIFYWIGCDFFHPATPWSSPSTMPKNRRSYSTTKHLEHDILLTFLPHSQCHYSTTLLFLLFLFFASILVAVLLLVNFCLIVFKRLLKLACEFLPLCSDVHVSLTDCWSPFLARPGIPNDLYLELLETT